MNATVGGAAFVAYTYAGDLPSGAFGWNARARVAFTLNYVHPEATPDPLDLAASGGGLVGRGFVSRDLLAATSLDDARARAQRATT